LPWHGASILVVARGFWARSLEGLQGFGGTIVVLSDVGSFLLLGPSILTAGRDGNGHLRGQSCPPNSSSSSEDVRCSDVTVMVTIPGTASCPQARPGPKPTGDQWRGASGIIGIRKQSHRDLKAESLLWIGFRFLLLSPPILTAGRDGHGHLRGQSCPTNSGYS
jgi:hypothetical protein